MLWFFRWGKKWNDLPKFMLNKEARWGRTHFSYFQASFLFYPKIWSWAWTVHCLYSLVISGITVLSCQSPDRISEFEGRKEIESQAISPTGTPRPGRSDFPHITQQARDRNRMNLGVPRSSGLGSSPTLGVCPLRLPLDLSSQVTFPQPRPWLPTSRNSWLFPLWQPMASSLGLGQPAPQSQASAASYQLGSYCGVSPSSPALALGARRCRSGYLCPRGKGSQSSTEWKWRQWRREMSFWAAL